MNKKELFASVFGTILIILVVSIGMLAIMTHGFRSNIVYTYSNYNEITKDKIVLIKSVPTDSYSTSITFENGKSCTARMILLSGDCGVDFATPYNINVGSIYTLRYSQTGTNLEVSPMGYAGGFHYVLIEEQHIPVDKEYCPDCN